jgi:tryptophan halogenase
VKAVKKIKDILVIGGGSAGWLTALSVKKSYPELNVTLVESKDIGILGAGEGSTKQLVDFLNKLDIPLHDLIQNCDATIKNAIKFTNWNNDNKYYYHGFDIKPSTMSGFDAATNGLQTHPLIISSIIKNNDFTEIDFINKISENNKVPFVNKNLNNKKLETDYENLGSHSIHFNASKFANRLKSIGLSRGIIVIEKTINNINLDQHDNVSSVFFEDGTSQSCDFVFDCSGFNRLIIGKIFDAKWKSYKDFLPVDSAIPFFIEMTEDIPPYTEAIAMKYGWMWKIPLQSRFGCGYVYDSSLISEVEAIKEIEEFLGYEPTYPRKNKGGFKFDAGCYETPWINNCVAVGLAANFIEPLEATSIWVTINMLNRLLGSPEWMFGDVDELRKEFNKTTTRMNNEISEFIYLHYMSERKDTEFWNKFLYDKAPETLKDKINLWQQRFPNKRDGGSFWGFDSWLIVALGINIVNKNIAQKYIQHSDKYKNGFDRYDSFINVQNFNQNKCKNHTEFLKELNEF